MLTHRLTGYRFVGFVGIAGVIACSFAAGCSFQTQSAGSCTDNAECRAIFGLRSICAADGFCETAANNARCDKTYPENLLTEEGVAEQHVIFGSVMERSVGIFRSFERAVELAFQQANREGGISTDKDLGVIFCNLDADDGGDGLTPELAVLETGLYLAEVIGVPAIIGPAKSGDAQELFQTLDGSGVMLISPSATSDALSALDPVNPSDESPGLLWRTAPPDALQADAIARDMRVPDVMFGRTVAINTAVVIFQEGPYGRGLAERFAEAFVAGGGMQPTILNFSDDVTRDMHITNAGNDALIEEVLFVSSDTTDTVAFFDLAASLATYDTKTIFVPDAAATSDVLDVANPARFPLTRGSRPEPLNRNEDLVYAALVAAYLTEFSEDIEMFSFTANAYDAAWLLGYGAAWATFNDEAISGKTIARGLRKLSAGDALQVGPGDWSAALQLLRANQGFDVEGSSGELDYNPLTEETSAPTEIWTITGTTIVGRYGIEP